MAALTHVVCTLASKPMALARLQREPDAFLSSFGLSMEQANIVRSNDFHLLGQAISAELGDAEGNCSFLFRLSMVDDEEEKLLHGKTEV